MDYAPTNLVDAQFSLPVPVAMALLSIPPGPDWYTPELLADPEVRRLASLVNLHITDEMNHLMREKNTWANKVVITTHTGACYDAMVPVPSGSPSNPLPDGALEGKFRRNSQAVLTPAQIEKLLALIINLESEGTLTGVFELLRGEGSGLREPT